MDIEILPIVSRWFHIGPIIVAIGGIVFMRFVMMPAIHQSLDSENHDKLCKEIFGRWKRVVHVCIALILLSGSYNVYNAIVDQGKPVLYHILFLPKLLAALGVFFIASALVGKSAAFAGMRAQRGKWLTVLIALAVLIILISGVMKNLPDKPSAPGDAEATVRVEASSRLT